MTVHVSADRRRQRRFLAKPSDKAPAAAGAAGAAGGVLSGWTAPSHEAVPAHLFAQHVRQLHADAGEACRREWEALQMVAPPADEPRTNGATKHGPGPATDVLAQRCE